jgi:hypothetical protein
MRAAVRRLILAPPEQVRERRGLETAAGSC